jgi:hypothetical protein
VGTCNIRNTPDLPRAQVREAAHVCSVRADLVGFQEIGEVQDHTDVRIGLGDTWSGVAGGTGKVEVPIHFRKSLLELIPDAEVPGGFANSGFQLAHHGLAHVSPNRYTTWAMLRAKSNHAIQFAIVNAHMVSKPTDTNATHHRWREEMWHVHYSKWAAMVNNFNDHGLTVLAVGDFNRLDVPKSDRDMRWAWKSGIDKIGMIKGKTPVSLIRVASYNTPSDHNLRVAKVALG